MIGIAVLTSDVFVPMNDALTILKDGGLAIEGQTIVAVGRRAELLTAYPEAQTAHYADRILMPGLINAHAHSSMLCVRRACG
ncbi:MAG: hypothetical protein AAF590_02005 [Pseudomonadota bacterium]